MNTIMTLHSLTRWLVLLFGVMTVFTAISGMMSRSKYSALTDKSSLLFMIMFDIQVVFGFVLYFENGWFDRLKHLGDFMKDSLMRFFTLEHWLLMLIAWVLVHAGRTAVKKAPDSQAKYKKALIYFGIVLLLILIAIPWPFREAVARPWFRWF
ncbi:MAG: hypothetical protein J5I50_00920 [Chitinophagaceae bacterium]|nr:hypothetical protein [Chitinophagaceae bacterium]